MKSQADVSPVLHCLDGDAIHNRRAWLKWSLLTGASVALPFQSLQASEQEDCQVEVYELSTRHLGCGVCSLPKECSLDIHRATLDTCYTPSSLVDATAPAADQRRITVLYAHGNWMTRENARERAKIIARHLRCRSQQPLRVLMLSWPSQRERHPIADIRENAACTDTQAFYLAYVLRVLVAEESTSLLGFSFGGRIVTGALHLLAGGAIQGRKLEEVWPESAACHGNDPTVVQAGGCKPAFRVSLIAPAVDQTSLQPHGVYHLAMGSIDKLVNIYNSRDPVLRRFRFLDSGSKPIAAGFSGFLAGNTTGDPPATQPLAKQDRIYQYDCDKSLGVTHDERTYLTKCSNIHIAYDNLLWK